MNITFINGSPKAKNSTSQLLSDYLVNKVESHHKTNQIRINRPKISDTQINIIKDSDVLVFIFPLYIDAIPSQLFQVLIDLESILKNRDIKVCGVVNCGFYEAQQTRHALTILQNWCHRTNLNWLQGVGLGGGEGIRFGNVALGHGQLTSSGEALDKLSKNILQLNTERNIFSTMNYPRFIYIIGSKYAKWNPLLKKNGLKPKDAFRRV